MLIFKTLLINKSILATAFVSLVFAVSFSVFYINQEHFLYLWDYLGYFSKWQCLIGLLENNPLEIFHHVRESMKWDDYNCLPVLLPSLFGLLFGSSRTVYILSLAVCYIVPVSILFGILVREIILNEKCGCSIAVIATVLCALFPGIWTPTLRGYPDIAGVIPLEIGLLLVLKNDLTRLNLKAAIFIGFSFWLIFALRRWYAYTLVALYLVTPLLNYWLNAKSLDIKKLFYLTINYVIAGGVSLICLFAVQRELAVRILRTSYGSIYQAYDEGYSQAFLNLSGYAGIVFVILSLLALIILLRSNTRLKWIAISFTTILCLSFAIFIQTQTPGMQHCLPFEFWLLVVLVSGGSWLACQLHRSSSIMLAVTSIILFSLIFLNVYFPQVHLVESISKVLPAKQHPLRLENYDTYLQVAREVSELDGDVVIISSSGVLVEDMLRYALTSEQQKSIRWMPHVDLRDGIALHLYKARYVIVTDPIQTHLRPEDQLVVVNPAESILNGRDIGKAYRPIRTWELAGGVKGILYEKMREFTISEFREHFEHFYARYPDWRKVYDNANVDVGVMMKEIREGDIWGGIYSDQRGINTHPGENYSTRFTVPAGLISALEVRSTSTQCNVEDTIRITVSWSDSKKVINLQKGTSARVEGFPEKNEVTIDIAKEKSSGCDAVHLNFYR